MGCKNSDIKLLTIGIPIYNNESTLSRAIDSVLSQSGFDFIIILSDDGSSDNSWDICQKYAALDHRITAIRQKTNLYYNNFKYVLDAAKTPYFCWLAGDDYFEDGFLKKAIETLVRQEDAVAAIGECWFYEESEFVELANGSYAIVHDDAGERLEEYLSASTDNSRMYGVFRTKSAQQSFPSRLFYTYDFVFSSLTLTYGKHVHLGMVAIHRDKTNIESYRKLVRKDAKNILTRLFPLLPMTYYLMRHKQVNITWPIFKKLMMLNFNAHLNYCEYFHDSYYKFLIAIQNEYTRRIGWRFKQKSRD